MSMFSVDEKCIKCGLCASLCPSNVITYVKYDKPYVTIEKESRCIQCGQCVSFCPKSACYLSFQPSVDRIPVDPVHIPVADEVDLFLRSRRSIRTYREDEVGKDIVLNILESARYAPTASNRQPVRWVVCQSRKKTSQLAQLVINAFKAQPVPASGTAASTNYAGIVSVWEKGVDIIFRGAPQVAVAVVNKKSGSFLHEDAAIALTYFELAAYASRIGCCWAGFFTIAAKMSKEIYEFLGVGEDEIIAGAQMFGYPMGISFCNLLPPRKKVMVKWLT